MFGSLFSSKNQKLVKKWVKEHEQIVVHATKIITAHSNDKHKTIKKELKALRALALNHIMTEDIEFFRLLKDQKKLDNETKKHVNEFTNTFKGTKLALINFLTKYTQDTAVYDEQFIETFNEIVDILEQRIAFEEENLYVTLNAK